jgi:ketosteroid isomerase-like protein
VPSFAPAQAQSSKRDRAVADSLLALDRRWGQAYVTGDSAFVAGFLAEDWIGWFDDGQETKGSALAQLRTGAPRLLEDIVDQATVRVFGTMAIVQARERNRVADSTGARHWETRHITDVFIVRKGRWMVVASHDSRIPNPLLGGLTWRAPAKHDIERAGCAAASYLMCLQQTPSRYTADAALVTHVHNLTTLGWP